MMFRRRRVAVIAAGTLVAIAGTLGIWGFAVSRLHHTPDAARIEFGDVERFLTTMEMLRSAKTYPDSLRVVDESYFARGTSGLNAFVKSRIGDSDALLSQMKSHKQYYAHVSQSLTDVGQFEKDTRAAFRRFEQLYPSAGFADVYLVIGRMNSGGTTSPSKILIGAEMYAADSAAPRHELTEWERSVLRDTQLIPTIVIHELIHLNQRFLWRSNLLKQALREGSADFIAELVTGKNINAHVHQWAATREQTIWEEFQRDMHGKEYSKWFGQATANRPADVGYWVGYRIAQAYYEKAADKAQAINDILRVSDAESFLAASGYAGGSALR